MRILGALGAYLVKSKPRLRDAYPFGQDGTIYLVCLLYPTSKPAVHAFRVWAVMLVFGQDICTCGGKSERKGSQEVNKSTLIPQSSLPCPPTAGWGDLDATKRITGKPWREVSSRPSSHSSAPGTCRAWHEPAPPCPDGRGAARSVVRGHRQMVQPTKQSMIDHFGIGSKRSKKRAAFRLDCRTQCASFSDATKYLDADEK